MTALRWFLSYLLPMLILASIAAAYFYRDQLSSNWYRTVSWPVTQINYVLQQQKLKLNIVESAQASALPVEKMSKQKNVVKSSDEQESVALTSDVESIKKIKPKSEESITIQTEKPLMHPIDSGIEVEKNTTTPLMHPIVQELAKMPILPKTSEPVKAKISEPVETKSVEPKLSELKQVGNKTIPEEKIAIAPQAQQYYRPYPQQRMRPEVRRFKKPRLPTLFKINKKYQKLLYKARKAYWTKDFKNAKKHYLVLIKKLPDNPDVHGELGNLFYFDRKLELAIKQYVLAAKLAIKHRHYWKLPQIMKIVSRFNPTKATEIMQLMRNRNTVTTNKSIKGK